MYHAHIIGTGSSVPERILTNSDLETIVDTSDEWITRRSGIKERRISRSDADESTTALGTYAARQALQTAGITAEHIDTIIVATVTGDKLFPSTACLVQKELNALNAAAYDISAGCSGFLYALDAANNSIKSGAAGTVLIIGAERLSSVVNWKDRSTCVLLGDGAGAAVVQRSETKGGIYSAHIKSDGNYWDLLYSEDGNDFLPDILKDVELRPYNLKMEGNRLFKHAVSLMARMAEHAMETNQLRREDINILIPHQANIRILSAVAEKLQIPIEKVFTNLHKFGNTSSASIPIAMDEAFRCGRLKSGDIVLLISFGAGLTWGAALMEWTMDP
jgi:3-oxoacyl-[acyl-carrier-protein] synthase-3